MVTAATMTTKRQLSGAAAPRLRLVPLSHEPVVQPRALVRTHAIVAIAVLVALAICALVATASSSARMSEAIERASWQEHVVRNRETLWDIARASEIDADPQMVVSAIIRRNGMDGALVRAGDSILAPASR